MKIDIVSELLGPTKHKLIPSRLLALYSCIRAEGGRRVLAQRAKARRYWSPALQVGWSTTHRLIIQIRCSGEQPACARCVRLSRDCLYAPAPPAARSVRFIPDSRSSNRRTVYAPTQSQVRNPSNHSKHGQLDTQDHTGSDPQVILTVPKDGLYLGISDSLMCTLVDTYFENAYNASLLLHKGRFLQSLSAGTAQAHLVLSICAYAAK